MLTFFFLDFVTFSEPIRRGGPDFDAAGRLDGCRPESLGESSGSTGSTTKSCSTGSSQVNTWEHVGHFTRVPTASWRDDRAFAPHWGQTIIDPDMRHLNEDRSDDYLSQLSCFLGENASSTLRIPPPRRSQGDGQRQRSLRSRNWKVHQPLVGLHSKFRIPHFVPIRAPGNARCSGVRPISPSPDGPPTETDRCH